MNRRTNRLGVQLLQEIGSILQLEIRDPRVGFATLTRVDITKDIAIAKVYVSVMGSEKEQRDTMIGLKQCASRVRKLLSGRLQIRSVPRLEFHIDRNLDHSFRIQELLSKLPENERADLSEAPAESGGE